MKVSRDTKNEPLAEISCLGVSRLGIMLGYHAWGMVVTITARMPHWHGITQQTLFSENPSYPKAT